MLLLDLTSNPLIYSIQILNIETVKANFFSEQTWS